MWASLTDTHPNTTNRVSFPQPSPSLNIIDLPDSIKYIAWMLVDNTFVYFAKQPLYQFYLCNMAFQPKTWEHKWSIFFSLHIWNSQNISKEQHLIICNKCIILGWGQCCHDLPRLRWHSLLKIGASSYTITAFTFHTVFL